MPLDPEEAAEAARAEAAARATGSGDPTGELVVGRRIEEIMPFVVGFMIAPIIGGLHSPLTGVALGAAVLAGVVLHARARVSRIVLSPDGRVMLPGHGEIDWTSLRALSVRPRHPFAASARERPHGTTLEVVFVDASGARLELARGQVFRRAPREPIPLDRLDAWLRGRAARAGMRVSPDPRGGWTAARG